MSNLSKVLKTVKCPACESKGQVIRNSDSPKLLRICTGCKSDFDTNGNIIFNGYKAKKYGNEGLDVIGAFIS